MEQLLHYVWQHRLFPLHPLATTEGMPVEVVDTGLHNHDAGPDFFNAKVRIGGQMWVGNIEIHQRASDWFRHHHDSDPHYNNVVLHVVETNDMPVTTAAGNVPPQLVIEVPADLRTQFERLCHETHYPPCHSILADIPPLHTHAWLNTLALERLEAKTERIHQLLQHTTGDWERTFFVTLARAFGFGKNTDTFEQWALTIDPQHIGKHRDHIEQVEAFFLGQAGLLDENNIPPEQRDTHFRTLQQEYRFLQKKFQLTPIPHSAWKFLRLRPQNFPYRRLAQLVELYFSQRLDFSKMRAASTLSDIRKLLKANTLPYWTTHYVFGKSSQKMAKDFDNSKIASRKKSEHIAHKNRAIAHTETPLAENNPPTSAPLTTATIDLLIINAVVPTLFAYGKQHNDEERCQHAFALLEAIAPERNSILNAWQQAGITAQHAADAQALLQLKQNYCDRRDCLRCRFGTRFLQPTSQPSQHVRKT